MVFYIYFIVAVFYYVNFIFTEGQAILPDLKQILETPSTHTS